MGGVGGEKQTHVALGGAAQRQHHFVPAGLVNFIDLGAGGSLAQLMDQAGQAQGV